MLFGWVNIGGGISLIIFAIPLLARQIKPNRFYGFRISKALDSDKNWYAINSFWAKKLVIWSVVTILCGIAFCFLESSMSITTGLMPVLLFTVIATVETLGYARKF